jgi:GDP-4-dehydro-6-deoxy-D-mannose reductase
MRILITGASGFIGRNLSAFAVRRGHEVVGTYHSTSELSARDLPATGVKWVRLDMQDSKKVAKIVDDVGPEAVFHLAAQAYAQKAWSDPADTFRTNVLGTIYLYEALKTHPPQTGILLAASGASYGVPPRLPITEDIPLNATNPYGVSKACQDMLSLQYSLNFGLRILRARLFGTTGPGKTGDAMNDFAKQVAAIERKGRPGRLKVGNLGTMRDVSDIRDVVRALWLVFEKGNPKEPVNVGAGQSYSIRWIADQLVGLSKVPLEIVQEPSLLRPTDEPDNRADVTRLLKLGYERKYPLERTISDALDFWRSEPAAESAIGGVSQRG